MPKDEGLDIHTQVVNENFELILENVLYVPQNPHNLLSLGRWDNAGGSYQGIDENCH